MKFSDLLFQNEGLLREKNSCYGLHKGYYVTAEIINTDMFGVVQFDDMDEGRRQNLLPFISTLQQNYKRCDIVAYVHSIQIHIRTSALYKKDAMNLERCMNAVIDFLSSIGVGTGCANCGSHDPLQVNHYGQLPRLICPNCLQTLNRNIQQEASKPKVKSNVITGTVGALLGTLVGVALWFIIYRLGYISALGGLVMAVGAMFGYEKLGKSLDLKGVIISAVIVLVMVYITNRICWAYEFMEALNDRAIDMSFSESFRNIEDFIKQVDGFGSYIRDLVIGYLLTVVGVASMIVSQIKNR